MNREYLVFFCESSSTHRIGHMMSDLKVLKANSEKASWYLKSPNQTHTYPKWSHPYLDTSAPKFTNTLCNTGTFESLVISKPILKIRVCTTIASCNRPPDTTDREDHGHVDEHTWCIRYFVISLYRQLKMCWNVWNTAILRIFWEYYKTIS